MLATDPDADRLGVYVKDAKTGEYHALTGNMSGCLLADYEIGQRKEMAGGKLPADGALVKSIVTTNMADAIAKAYGIQLIEVLTGFKYIGQKILEFETTGKVLTCLGLRRATVVSSAPMPEIRMPSWRPWHWRRLPLTTRPRA